MFVQKLHKQHNSVVMTIPPLIRKRLGVSAGDYVSLDVCSEFPVKNMVCMRKLELKDVRGKGNSDRPDKGG